MRVNEESYTKIELARALRTIEEMVGPKDLMESKMRVIEQSDFWREHAKTHEGAKLEILNVDIKTPKSIRVSLGLEDVDYKLNENIEFVGYGPETSVSHSISYGAEKQSFASADGSYMAATSDPKNKHFWMGCQCGLKVKAEDDSRSKGIHISTYEVGPTVSYQVANETTYGSSNVSYS